MPACTAVGRIEIGLGMPGPGPAWRQGRQSHAVRQTQGRQQRSTGLKRCTVGAEIHTAAGEEHRRHTVGEACLGLCWDLEFNKRYDSFIVQCHQYLTLGINVRGLCDNSHVNLGDTLIQIL